MNRELSVVNLTLASPTAAFPHLSCISLPPSLSFSRLVNPVRINVAPLPVSLLSCVEQLVVPLCVCVGVCHELSRVSDDARHSDV